MTRLRLIATLPVVIASILACSSPLSGGTVVPVSTVVELTLSALTSAGPRPPDETPSPPNVLPHPLYFMDRDAAGLRQIFRLNADGGGLRQITFEPADVNDYDVSRHDGRLAYTSNNQLFLTDAVGAGRGLLLDGGPIDDNNRWTEGIFRPTWSPDGNTLAYNQGGLRFHDLTTGASTKVVDNQLDTTPGFPIVREVYLPKSYSPDGSSLLIDIAYYEAGTYAFYLPSSRTVVRFTRADGSPTCCYTDWAPDGSGVYITSPSIGLVDSGLYYADASSGAVTAMLPGHAPDGTFNFAWSAQRGADGNLFFFFNNLQEEFSSGTTPLYLVRSAADGVTDRVRLLPDAVHNIREILWAPDASLAVVVVAPDPGTSDGGEARVFYTDGRPIIVLAPSAEGLRWGL